ncbi:hypothetical protein Goarm_005056 [Gossypium armourianum]|uniref:DUF4283 domain-containing protein n=1 Tax=Gossypium armourianum TaxID=34283 RepID=A0A7J9JYS6_9ROSI|nr:hypothetical protein [Gossypium armourianum]
MEDELANLSLVDDEEEAIQEEAAAVESISQFCLVGRCLTDSFVHFPSLRNTMADLWHPIRGICITDIGENVLELNFTEFWIQVHELPPGLMSESMAKQLGNFCGKFLEYDTAIPFLGQKTYMRIRVKNRAIKNYFWLGFTLRAEVRCRATEMSRWLRETDGSQCFTKKLQNIAGGQNNWRTWGKDVSVTDGLGKGPMDLVLEEENDPITMVEEKKRQTVVEGPIDYLGSKTRSGSMDLSTSSGEQSSRAQ